MIITIISRCAPVEWIVIQEVIRNFNHVSIIKTTPSQVSDPGAKGIGHWINGNGIKVLNKLQKISLGNRFRSKLEKFPETLIHPLPSNEMNNIKGRELLASFSPDILITCHAPILQEEVLAIPKKAAINIHFGISPEYRGNHTLFWPQYNKEFQHIGGTIHYLAKGIDSGNILAQVYPSLLPSDGEVDLIEKTANLLSGTLVEVLKRIGQQATTPPGKVQSHAGRNYKKAKRTFWISLKFIVIRSMGFYRSKPRPQKVEFFI